MSGVGKKIAKVISKGIDWDHITKAVVSDEGRRELFSLRRSFDDVSNTLETKFNTVSATSMPFVGVSPPPALPPLHR